MQNSTRFTVAALLGFALTSGFGLGIALAQGDKPANPDQATTAQAEPKAPKPQPQPFTLTLTVKESESGKVIAHKNYTLTVMADDNQHGFESMRDGDRIPYTGEKGREYQDVGTNIDVERITRVGDSLFFMLRINSSSLTAKSDGVNLPEVNRWNVGVNAIIVPGKPTVVYSATDVVTGHKVEVVATAHPFDSQ